jgi:hypothetical protein
MAKKYQIYPEVAGNIANSEFIDVKARPPLIKKLVYEFDGWPDDDIITSIGIFIVTKKLKERIENENATGAIFDQVHTIVSEQFIQLHGDKGISIFYWLKVDEYNTKLDFFRSPNHRLIVSLKGFNILNQFQIKNADIEEYEC